MVQAYREMKVLNIGAGFLPIVASDLEVNQLINYDPLEYKKGQGLLTDREYEEAYSFLRIRDIFQALIASRPDIQYFKKRKDVDNIYPIDSVDLVISISPYGFTLIDTWVDEKIKKGGYIIVLGNSTNPYVTQDKKLFEFFLKADYTERDAEFQGGLWGFIEKLTTYYKSHTSKLEDDTALNKTRIFRKLYEYEKRETAR